jgi:hypothetical protein
MIKLLWLSVGFGTFIALLLGVCCARPSWAASLGLGGSNVREAEKELAEVLQRQNELDLRREQVLERSEGMHAVIADLIAARITLVQAAVEFRRLSRTLPGHGRSFNENLPGNSEGERLCRHVIQWTEASLNGEPPSVAQPIVADLTEELRHLLREDGAVHMPGD